MTSRLPPRDWQHSTKPSPPGLEPEDVPCRHRAIGRIVAHRMASGRGIEAGLTQVRTTTLQQVDGATKGR
jgi:hypothetical protein